MPKLVKQDSVRGPSCPAHGDPAANDRAALERAPRGRERHGREHIQSIGVDSEHNLARPRRRDAEAGRRPRRRHRGRRHVLAVRERLDREGPCPPREQPARGELAVDEGPDVRLVAWPEVELRRRRLHPRQIAAGDRRHRGPGHRARGRYRRAHRLARPSVEGLHVDRRRRRRRRGRGRGAAATTSRHQDDEDERHHGDSCPEHGASSRLIGMVVDDAIRRARTMRQARPSPAIMAVASRAIGGGRARRSGSSSRRAASRRAARGSARRATAC